jgi:O-antigen ligase
MLFWASSNKLRILKIFVPVAIVFFVALPETYVERIESIWSYEKDESAMGRIRAWSAGMEMGEDHPFTGVGLKCFELPEVYSRYAEGVPRVAHNAYIQLYAETGLPALIAWLSLILTGIFGAVALVRKNISFETQSFARAIAFSLILYLVGSIVLNSAYFELPYILLASFVVLRKICRQAPARPETAAARSQA